MIRALLIDADGVIQTAPHTRSRLRALVPEGEENDRFLTEVFRSERPCLTGQKDFREELPKVLDRWGVEAPAGKVHAIWEAITLIIDVADVVSDIRAAGIPCYLATNQQIHRADYMRAAFNYDALFDGSFYSYQIGAAKPDPGYFNSILSELALVPGDILFIDDNTANIEAAQACGFTVLQFDATTIENPGDALRSALGDLGFKLQL